MVGSMATDRLALHMRLRRHGAERRYVLTRVPEVPGWGLWVEESGSALRLGILTTRTEADARRAAVDAEIHRLLTTGWRVVPPSAPAAVLAADPARRDLAAVIEPFMERLQALRGVFDRIDSTGKLRLQYEQFRCNLATAGFRVSGLAALERARRFRRLGELADAAGAPGQAIRFYRAAVASWARVGVARRLRALERAGWTAE